MQPGEVYRWHKGTCLQATETSSFIIPGAVFENGIPMGETLELSDDEAEIVALEEPSDDRYPDMAVMLKPNVQMRLNRNCEVIHVHIKSEDKHTKEFVVVNTGNK